MLVRGNYQYLLNLTPIFCTLYCTLYCTVYSTAESTEMIYNGPGFLAVVCFGSSPTPFPPLPFVSLTGDTEED